MVSAHMFTQPIGILTHYQKFHTLLIMAAWFQLKIRFLEGIRSVRSGWLLQELYWRASSFNKRHSICALSTVPARYAEDITTANTCADQRCYHSKSFRSNRYYEVRLELSEWGSWGLEIAGQPDDSSGCPTMHSTSPVLELLLILSIKNQS